MIEKMVAVSRPRTTKDIPFKTKATPLLFIKEVPSNILDIQRGRTLSIKRAANPNVKTTIRDDFLFSLSS